MKEFAVPLEISEVHLTGTELSVWFVHSTKGIALGPFTKGDAEDACGRGMAIGDLALSTIIPVGGRFPDSASYVGISDSGPRATIWRTHFEGGLDCCFVMLSSMPIAFTAKKPVVVDAYLKRFHYRAKRWTD